LGLEISGLLDDKYEILKRLATGGMGDVYLVRHRHLQERRVVKVLRADLQEDEDAMQRFQLEARVATQIKHPNVAILYDYSLLPDGRFYMVWEYIEGEDLASRLRKGAIPMLEAIEHAIQALRGLDAIHGAGVIHRDISPDNLMLTKDVRGRSQLKIIDLGLAKDVNLGAEAELTQAGSFLGKFQYCSPEQAGYLREAPLDHRSDLYSLSQVLYEMVTGLPPFESESQHGFVLKRLTEEPLPLRTRNPQVPLPPALEMVVMKGLSRDREQRFGDAATFAQALRKVADGLREVSTQELSSEMVRRALDSGRFTVPVPEGTTRELPKVPSSHRGAVPPGEASGRAAAKTVVKSPGKKAADPFAELLESVTSGKTPVSGTSELSRAEKEKLLARIDAAASRVQEGGQTMALAEAALKEGRFEEARALVAKLEGTQPAPRGLGDLRRRLQEAEEIARRRQQVLQAEQMLEKYLLDRQQTLASLALETLLDLYPNHPKRADYDAWVRHLGDEAEQQKRAERLFAEAQAAVARGDVATAKRLCEDVERLDLSGKLAGTLLAEIREAEQRRASGQKTQSVRVRLEEALRRGAVEEATHELEALAALEVTKVTLDLLRGQVEEARQLREQEEAAAAFEGAFADAVARHDWFGAREMARQMEDALPGHPRPRQMVGELARMQEADQRQRAIDEGLRAFEGYLQSGQIPQAELALRVLRQMGADDPRVGEAERRLQAAR
jgi:serine/threonine protein kinase